MQVWNGVQEVPGDLAPTAATLGIFDGVHRGHQVVLGATVRRARSAGLSAVAITFDPHPAAVHRPEKQLALVSTLTDRYERMAETGLDGVLVLPYTLDFARASPEEFVRTYLVQALHAAAVVVGEDVRFGWQNAGDRHVMEELGRRYGFDVEIITDIACPDTGRRWSSTWVRELLAAGDVEGAARVLGRPHRVRGVVVHGHKRGRALGYPTANLRAHDLGVVPADGVYAGWLRRPTPGADPEPLPAAISVGTNPTFHGVERTVEAYVLGRTDLDLYDEEVVVELVRRLRPMVAFEGIEELKEQMARDVAGAAEVLGVTGRR